MTQVQPQTGSGTSIHSILRIWAPPITVFLIVVLATFAMWQSQRTQEQDRMRREVRLATEVLAASLKGVLDAQIKDLTRMADR